MKTSTAVTIAVLGTLLGSGWAVAENLRGAAVLMDGNECNFDVYAENGKLFPSDRKTGEGLGFFERMPEGVVILTTPEGFCPNVTSCFFAKGLGAELVNIQPYSRPGVTKRMLHTTTGP